MIELPTISPLELEDFQPYPALPPISDKPGKLVSYSLPWPDTSLLAFLKQAANTPRIFWERGPNDLSFAGCGLGLALTANGPQRFQVIQQQAAQLFAEAILEADDAPPGIGPRLFGGFAFWAEATPQGFWSAFPAAHFILPRFQLTRLAEQSWLTVNHYLAGSDEPDQILRSMRADVQNLRLALELAGQQEVTPWVELNWSEMCLETDYPMDSATWQDLITTTTQRIRRGELNKVVLARICRVRASRRIEPVNVLAGLKRNYAGCYRFLIEPAPGHAFYGATPELLAEVTSSSLHTIALAGSIRRGRTPEEDAALGQELLTNPKERQEHAFVVEALQKNLRPLVTELQVAPQPNLYRLSNIQHLQTVVQGKLANPCGVLPVVEALHPTPAMGGSPRVVALRLIKENEPFSRGWYAAPVGWLDAQGNGCFAVAIRSAVSVGHEAYLFAGAGIVADSDPLKEWHETGLKFRPMLEALGGAWEAP
jgi:menaquinone-specific isochorismate synthase